MYSIELDIFQYDNFRVFLKDSVEELRQHKDLFSYRKFSMAAGFSSPNFLILLIKGDRNLSEQGALKIATAFGLENLKQQFFLSLVHYTQASSPSEKFIWAQTLLKIKTKANLSFIEEAQFDYYTSWIHVAIRELLLVHPHLSDEVIASRLCPQVKVEEVRKSLELLQKLEMIEKLETRWLVKETSLSTGSHFVSSSVVEFHKQMMKLGQESLDRFTRAHRDVTASTIGISKESFELIRQKVHDLRQEILAIAENDQNKERVYQVNFQVFPLTTQEGESK
jgi:uncharacterized protein (TIGR02147 family)